MTDGELRRPLLRGIALAAGWAALLAGGAVLAGVRDAHPAGLAAGALLLAGSVIAVGFRWAALLPAGVPPRALAGYSATGVLVGLALPGPVGELVAAGLLARRSAVSAEEGLAASLHARVLGLATAALLALGIWAVFPLPIPEGYGPLTVAAVLVVLAATSLLALASAGGDALARIADTRLPPRLAAPLSRFSTSLARLGREAGHAHVRAAAWSLVGHACTIGATWALAVSLGGAASPAGVAFTYAAMTAGGVALFVLPVGQVGLDAGFCVLLAATAGLSPSTALAVTAAVRALHTAMLASAALTTILRPIRLDTSQ